MKQLAIQEYLRSGKTLTDLKQEYHIDSIVNNELSVVVFNYTHLTPMTTEIGREARALFLQLETWFVVGMSIGGFLDIDSEEVNSTLETFNWNKAKAYTKYDGCLIVLYYYKDQWRLGTRFSTDGRCNVFSPNSGESEIHWVDVFKNTLVEYGMQWEYFCTLLDEYKYYTFELCTPWNRNTVIYPNSLIKLLAIVDSNTLLEEDINEPKLRVFQPEFEVVNALEEVYSLISKNDDPLENEGCVVVDENYTRLKVRNPKYNLLSYKPYNVNDFDNLKKYSQAIMLLASEPVVFFCVSCNPEPGWGPPTITCYSGLESIGPPNFPPYLNCAIQIVANCFNDCIDPVVGGEGGILSTQPVKGCSTSWNPKVSSIPKDENITSLVNDFVSFIGWFNNKYLEYKSTENVLVKELLVSIWSYAFDELSKGKSISEIIISSYEVDQVKALELYHLIVLNN